MNNGFLLVISSPSGGGKTTILRHVMATVPGLVFSVSHTTRKPRPGEVEGSDYHFVSRETFREIETRDPTGFLEWAEVHGNLYGTGRDAVQEQVAAGRDVVLDIDVQGAMQVMEAGSPVTVFIAPPSLAELERRLRKRGTESEDSLAVRLANARTELSFIHRYEYLIINDRLDEAVNSLRSIIIAERSRRRRKPEGKEMAEIR